jgi:hypothetical protein
MSLFESKDTVTCSGACDGCKSWGAATESYQGDLNGARLAGWSVLVFLFPLFTAAAGAYVFRGRGPSVGAGAGLAGLCAGSGVAWAIFHGARRRNPTGAKPA